MKSFKEYHELQEKIVSGQGKPKLTLRMLEEMMKDVKKIKGPIMFKGLREGGVIALVSSHRKEFNWYGLHNAIDRFPKEASIVVSVIRKLGFKNPPVFCSANMRSTYQFGDTYIVIPRGKYRILWSPKVRDILANTVRHGLSDKAFKSNDQQKGDGDPLSFLFANSGDGYINYDIRAKEHNQNLIDYLADSYKELKKAPKRFEILLDTKEYWIIRPDSLEHVANLAGFDDKDWDQFTYEELEKLLKAVYTYTKRNDGEIPTY